MKEMIDIYIVSASSRVTMPAETAKPTIEYSHLRSLTQPTWQFFPRMFVKENTSNSEGV